MMGGYKSLKVYKRAFQLALNVHKKTLNFPDFEKYELGSQLRRSSKSIAANIAEGYGRGINYKKELVKYLINALGSIDETKVHLDFSFKLNYILKDNYSYYINEYDILGKQINKLIKVIKKDIK